MSGPRYMRIQVSVLYSFKALKPSASLRIFTRNTKNHCTKTIHVRYTQLHIISAISCDKTARQPLPASWLRSSDFQIKSDIKSDEVKYILGVIKEYF